MDLIQGSIDRERSRANESIGEGGRSTIDSVEFVVGDESDIPGPRVNPLIDHERLKLKLSKAKTGTEILDIARGQLSSESDQGRYSVSELTPSNEYPRFLTRLPIFGSMSRNTRKRLQDQDGAIPFETGWGRGRVFGNLSIYDEDTLMGLGRLRQNQLSGHPSDLLIPLTARSGSSDSVKVDVLTCFVSDIQNVLGVSSGGNNNAYRLKSLKRLAAATIELEKCKDVGLWPGEMIRFFELKWLTEQGNENGLKTAIQVQFSPIVADALSNNVVFIDWKTRRNLSTDLAKAVHRFLASQFSTTNLAYKIGAKTLQNVVGNSGTYANYLVGLRKALDELGPIAGGGLGWLSYAITGTGRKTPHMLNVIRTPVGHES